MPVGPFPFAQPGSLVWNSSEGAPTLYYVLADGTWHWVLQAATHTDAEGTHITCRRNSLPQEMIDAGFEVEENDLWKTDP